MRGKRYERDLQAPAFSSAINLSVGFAATPARPASGKESPISLDPKLGLQPPMTRGGGSWCKIFSLPSCHALLEPDRRRNAGQQHLVIPGHGQLPVF